MATWINKLKTFYLKAVYGQVKYGQTKYGYLRDDHINFNNKPKN